MSREAFRYVEESVPLTRFHDLERVAVVCAAVTDLGEQVPAGTEGTVEDVIQEGVAYAVEFFKPLQGLATLLPYELRSIEGRCRTSVHSAGKPSIAPRPADPEGRPEGRGPR